MRAFGSKMRKILLAAGYTVWLVGAFLNDPQPAWGALERGFAAAVIRAAGLVSILVGIAIRPWPWIELRSRATIRLIGLGVIAAGLYLFDPRQGYSDRLSISIDGNVLPLAILVSGIALTLIVAAVDDRRLGRMVVLVAVPLCLAFGAVMGTRVPRQEAVETGLDYFPTLDGVELVGAWFGVEKPYGISRAFKTTTGRDPRLRPVWRIEIVDIRDGCLGCVWVGPWSGEILAVDGPPGWIH